MTNIDRTERIVRTWLAQSVEPPRVPEYLPDLIALTARTSQRPAWTLPERWIRMATVTRVQTAFAPVPWRTLALLALLVALVGSALVFYIGGSPRRPKPFGPAANGLVAYEWAGDIHAVDPTTGAATAITTGIAQDRDPVFSPDGTRIVFKRLVDGEITLVAADADGGNPVTLNGRFEEGPVSFSPDGTAVLAFALDRPPAFRVVPTDGSAARLLAPSFEVRNPTWRPTGGQILFVGSRGGEQASGLYLTDDSGLRTLVPPRLGTDLGGVLFSPDGSQVLYVEWSEANGSRAEVHVMTVDTGAIEQHELPPGVWWQVPLGWSNDGEFIAMGRTYDEGREVVAVVPRSDLSSVGIETPRDVPLVLDVEWAPDDSALLAMRVDAAGHRYQLEPVLIDPATGAVRPAPWDGRTSASWQRVAP